MSEQSSLQLFEQEKDGIWHPKFKVGVGLK